MDVEQGALLEDEGRAPSQREEMQQLQVRNKELLHKNAELERQVLNGTREPRLLLPGGCRKHRADGCVGCAAGQRQNVVLFVLFILALILVAVLIFLLGRA